MRRPEAALVQAALGLAGLLTSESLAAQACREPHYRWTQKTDTALADRPPEPTAVARILAAWAPPDLASGDRCAPRTARELRVYQLTAWVRRVEKVKDDGDWHIEVTERADSPADSCIVVEIPEPRYSPRYAQARAALDALIGGRKIGKRSVRIAGAAFFDGQHRRGGRRSALIDGEHGRCNSSVRALWEIHPVYRVTRP